MLNTNYKTTRLNMPLGEIQSLVYAVPILDLYFVVLNVADFSVLPTLSFEHLQSS